MSKSITTGSLLIASIQAGFAQGQIIFNNIVTGVVRAPIYGVDPSNPTIVQRFNPPTGIPAGTAVYGGLPSAGTGFSVQVFGGTTGTPESALVAASAILHFRTGSAAGFIDNSAGVYATIPGVAEGESANIQLRAWDNQGGTILSWDQVLATPWIGQSSSAMFVSQPLGGMTITPPYMVGLQSFSFAVPEPTTVSLGILSIGLLLFLRRRK